MTDTLAIYADQGSRPGLVNVYSRRPGHDPLLLVEDLAEVALPDVLAQIIEIAEDCDPSCEVIGGTQ